MDREEPGLVAPKYRRNKKGRIFLAIVALFVLLAWFAPTIVAHTSLVNWLARRALADMQGTVTVGSASLGWLQPVILQQVEIRDHHGQLVMVAPTIESHKTLWQLLRGDADMGTFRCLHPALVLTCKGERTNWEEVFAAWLTKDDHDTSSGSRPRGISVEVVDAQLRIDDADTKQQWTFSPVNLSLAIPESPTELIQLKCQGRLESETQAHARLEVALRIQRQAVAGRELENRVTAQIDNLPLAVCTPFLRRLESGLEIAGNLDATFNCRWQGGEDAAPRYDVAGNLAAQQLVVTGSVLAGDRLELERLSLPYRVTIDGRRVHVQQAELTCDIGTVALSGGFDPGLDKTAQLLQPGYSVEADIDLAQLAHHLPQTLHLLPDTQLHAGRLQAAVRSTAHLEGIIWTGKLHTTELAGTRAGKPIHWREPIAIHFAAHRSPKQWLVVDRLDCASSFLRIDASGSSEQFTAKVEMDLQRLSEHLGQFVDLSTIDLQGQGTAQVTVHRTDEVDFSVQANARLRQLVVAVPEYPTWREESLTLRLDAAGTMTDFVPNSLQRLELALQGGQEQVSLRLLEPMTDIHRGPWGSVQCRIQGDMARWRQRLQPWLGDCLNDCRLAGPADVTAVVRYQSDAIDLDNLQVALRQATIQGAGWHIQEPAIDLQTKAKWLSSTGQLELYNMTFRTVPLTLQAQRFTLSFTDMTMRGKVSVHGDVAKVRQWFQDPNTPPGEPITGQFHGQIGFSTISGRWLLQIDGQLQQLVYGPAASPTWSESWLTVQSDCQYDGGADGVLVDHLRLQAPGWGMVAAGDISRLSTSMDVNFKGHLQYDLEKMAPQLRSYLGDAVTIKGQNSYPFQLSGPLGEPARPVAVVVGTPPPPSMLATWKGNATLGWTSAQAYGLNFGAGRLQAQLADGWLRSAPVECVVNDGKLRVEPFVRLAPGAAELYLSPGTILERVRLTPAMCSSALGHALPVLANATVVEGQISAAWDGGKVPLANPEQADIGGKLTIHSVKVAPGPLVRELSILLRGPATLTLVDNSVVPVRMVNGRVYHQNLKLVFPELTITTSGYVGLDGSLSLIAEMPVPPKWVGPGRVGQLVANQTIRLPIGGTLNNPKIDESALRQANAQVLRDTANQAIRNEVQNQVEKQIEKKLEEKIGNKLNDILRRAKPK